MNSKKRAFMCALPLIWEATVLMTAVAPPPGASTFWERRDGLGAVTTAVTPPSGTFTLRERRDELGAVFTAAAASRSAQGVAEQSPSSEIERITVEELKTKRSAKAPMTIIDVRATDAYIGSDKKIKGAIHVKLRRLKSRLALYPLKDVPRDQEIVTYCA